MSPLRVGIALDSATMPAWQAALVESILRSPDAELVAALIDDRAALTAPAVDGARPGPLQRLLRRFEDHRRSSGPDALAAVACQVILGGIPQLRVAPRRRMGDFATTLRDLDLDILVALSDPGRLFPVAHSARLGIWYFEYSGAPFQPSDGSQVALAEVVRRSGVIHTALRISLNDRDRELVAYQSCSGVDCFSHTATCRSHLWKCSTFVVRAVEQCHRLGVDSFLRSLPSAPATTSLIAPQPTMNRLLRHIVLLPAFLSYGIWRYRQKHRRRKYRERWRLLYTGDADLRVLQHFEQLEPPEGRFWADPHVIEQGGAHYVFFEDASCETGKGRISCLRRDRSGRFSNPLRILDRPYHLSYPFVFEWRGEYFLVPESAENRTIELYQCVRFPDKWEFVHNIMSDVCAYDTTLVEHDDRWWMFATCVAREGISSWDELFIFHADNPMSRDWQSHPENPVISDVRRARPAGALFMTGNRLMRPSQNSAGRYGRALNLNEVQELSPLHYRETVRETIEPCPERGLVAVHTFSRAGHLTFVDAVRCERRRLSR